jgi:2-polyprenyl-6-methoxyphenol hydroxylase-like FAD-dependent oxidoreductase
MQMATWRMLMDTQLQLRFAQPIVPSESGLDGLSVDMLTLREILLTGLDGLVYFGKTFEHFEISDAGKVRAHFSDGTTATGDLLVGADGTASAVRRQLIPHAAVDDLTWVVNGRTPITDSLLQATPDVLIDKSTWVADHGGPVISIVTCRSLLPVATAAVQFAPDVMLTDIPACRRRMRQLSIMRLPRPHSSCIRPCTAS